MVMALCWSTLCAQDTFSIVAVDSATGEVGSAGASCLDDSDIAGGVLIISDILPGRGAIHTQAQWRASNQLSARQRMEAGAGPEAIVRYMSNPNNDVTLNPAVRQYGIVDFDSSGRPRAAAFTGNQAMDWKGDLTGHDYAIQGNILLGPEILDSMEARFLRTEGLPLADRLMAAMQGANVPGADTRCLAEGVSSQSAFLRVARPNDDEDSLYLDLRVTQTPQGEEPIDSLQKRFDAWKGPNALSHDREHQTAFIQLLACENRAACIEGGEPPYDVEIYSLDGQLLQKGTTWGTIAWKRSLSGVYLYRLLDSQQKEARGRILIRTDR